MTQYDRTPPNTSMHDAKLGDIYVDENGKLWRVVWTCDEPTVGMEAVEPSPPPIIEIKPGGSFDFIKQRLEGSVSGLMWQGFKRIWRKPEK